MSSSCIAIFLSAIGLILLASLAVHYTLKRRVRIYCN